MSLRPNLLALAPSIKTFTEGMVEGAEHTKLKSMVRDAEAVVFLGFSYQDQNLKLLAPDVRGMTNKRVFGTTVGISPMDQKLIDDELRTMFNPENDLVLGVHLYPVACCQYLRDYWRHLGASN